MLEITDTDLKTYPLDRHGLITAVCKDLQTAERIDSLLPVHEARVVSPGRAVVVPILNGLGFTPTGACISGRRILRNPVFTPDGTQGEKHRLLSALDPSPRGA